jgi:hypothetical protein
MRFSRPLTASSTDSIALALSIMCLLAIIVFRSLDLSINISTNHIDGTFQTASGLYRLDEGLCPGRDFLPYLGVGLLYVIYPLFKLVGGDVSSSMFAAHAITFISTATALLTVCLFCLNGRLRLSLRVAAALLTIGMISSPFDLPIFIVDRLQPGQSLRPIRSLAPYLAFLCAYYLLSKNKHSGINAIVLGCLAGICTLWSNDFGLPTVVALCGLSASLWLKKALSTKDMLLFAVALTASSVASLTIATCGSPLSLLSYNFLDIAKDQWWYFGPWSEKTKIFGFSDVGKLFATSTEFGLAVSLAALVFLLAGVSKKLEHIILAWLTVALLLGTLIVTIGGHIESGYLTPLIFHTFLIGIFLPLGYLADRQVACNTQYGSRITTIATNLTLLALVLVMAIKEAENYFDEVAAARMDPSRFFVSELGGFLPINWRNYVGQARLSTGSSVEEYWGLWSAIRRNEKIFPVDSLIHALGRTRDAAKHALEQNIDQVTTTRLGYSLWQQWSMSSNWWFYRHLILNYTPQSRSSATVVWQHINPKTLVEAVNCEVTDGIGRFLAPQPGLYDVSIVLQDEQPTARHLLLVRNGLVHAMKSDGYLSLPVYGRTLNFPMLVFENGRTDIGMAYRSLDDEQIPKIASCTSSLIDFEHPDVFLPPPTYLTTVRINNREWLNGFSRTASKILMFDTPQNRQRFVAGRKLKFADQSEREITEIRTIAPYLEVIYSGWRVEGLGNGNPAPISVQ